MDLAKLSLTFNPQKADHARAAALTLAGDVDNQIILAPNPTVTTVTLVDSDKKVVSGSDGVTSLFKQVRFPSMLQFVLWIPGVRVLLSKYLFPSKPPANRDTKPTAPVALSPTARG